MFPCVDEVVDLTVVGRTSQTLTLNWTQVNDGVGLASSKTRAEWSPPATIDWQQLISSTLAFVHHFSRPCHTDATAQDSLVCRLNWLWYHTLEEAPQNSVSWHTYCENKGAIRTEVGLSKGPGLRNR